MILTQERLKEVLTYDPNTGEFHWRIKPAVCVASGALAGCVHRPSGYVIIRFGQHSHRAPRLAFLYMTGSPPPFGMCIDHINGIRDDDRWSNLRLATSAQNNASKKLAKNNTSGARGVSWHQSQQWRAIINVNRVRRTIGFFKCFQEAQFAYQVAACDAWGEFARLE